MSINQATLLGNVGRDPDIRNTQSGDKVATFSIATTESYKDKATGERKDVTEWHTIVVFNQNIMPVIEQYVKKGSKVGVIGQIKTRKYTDKDGIERKTTEIVVGRFEGKITLEGAPRGPERDEHGYGATTTRQSATGAGNGASSRPAQQPQRLSEQLDDDIPF